MTQYVVKLGYAGKVGASVLIDTELNTLREIIYDKTAMFEALGGQELSMTSLHSRISKLSGVIQPLQDHLEALAQSGRNVRNDIHPGVMITAHYAG